MTSEYRATWLVEASHVMWSRTACLFCWTGSKR